MKCQSAPRKGKAPAQVCPTGRWTGPEALQQFVQCREQSHAIAGHAAGFARMSFPHPLFGPWDGYQWLLAAASHGARHTEQIREVKADRNFPANQAYEAAMRYMMLIYSREDEAVTPEDMRAVAAAHKH